MVRSAISILTLGVVLALAPEDIAVARARRELRVCADGNSLPFSNDRGEGFENKLAALVARDLGADVTYTWAPQRRGFIRTTLKAKRCDVVMGVPATVDTLATTQPYYRSGYVFVYGPNAPHVRSLDAPELRGMRIGVPLVGDAGANPPPVLALARRNLTSNLHGYLVYGDYRRDSPPADLLRGLRQDEVDIAVAWGPLAGYWATRPAGAPVLATAPIPASEAPPGLTFQFDIAMGVRHEDKLLRGELNAVITNRRKEIADLLDSYGVPRFP